MSTTLRMLMKTFFVSLSMIAAVAAQEPANVREVALQAPNDVKIRVRMEGPYTADFPLQVVCYFPYSEAAETRMAGAPVELDRHLGGIIGSLRKRGEFKGNELETLLIQPKAGSIPAKYLLLVGLGDEQHLSLAVLERVGQTAYRQAAALGVQQVAFAPLIRDQGNTAIPAAAVETAVLRGMQLANDTQHRLQNEGLAKQFVLKEWIVEAGPKYFDDTVVGVKKAIEDAKAEIAKRPSSPYE